MHPCQWWRSVPLYPLGEQQHFPGWEPRCVPDLPGNTRPQPLLGACLPCPCACPCRTQAGPAGWWLVVSPGVLVPAPLLQHAEAPGSPPLWPGAFDAQQHFPAHSQRCPPAARAGPARAAPRGRLWRLGPAEAELVAEEMGHKPSRPGKAVRGWGSCLKAWRGIALTWHASFGLAPLRTQLWHQPSFCGRCWQALRQWRAENGRCPARQPLALKSLALDMDRRTCSYQPLTKPSALCRETAEAQDRVRSMAARGPPPLEPWVTADH